MTTYAGTHLHPEKDSGGVEGAPCGGLGRVYLGVETGWDTLLKKVNKGVNAQQMLEAGLRLKEAGLELWAIVSWDWPDRGRRPPPTFKRRWK